MPTTKVTHIAMCFVMFVLLADFYFAHNISVLQHPTVGNLDDLG